MTARRGLWKDNCSKCNKECSFTWDGNLYRFRSNGKICNSCSRLGQKRTDEQKDRISKATKEAMSRPEVREKLLAVMKSDIVREKQRNAFARQIKATGTNVPYNPDACKFFEALNEFMNWSGKHAENGGEVCVGGFWVDYYEPTENLVIEWDEIHHKKPAKKHRDEYRQKYIIKKLNCEFYRIDEETLFFRKIA